MREYFVDSFYWLAILNPDDAHRESILRWSGPPGRYVFADAIRFEVMDALSSRRLRVHALKFWDDTLASPIATVVPVDGDLLARAVDLFRRRPDKDWSLTDCVSFVVMADRGIRTVLTGDRHFEQAGFEIAFK